MTSTAGGYGAGGQGSGGGLAGEAVAEAGGSSVVGISGAAVALASTQGGYGDSAAQGGADAATDTAVAAGGVGVAAGAAATVDLDSAFAADAGKDGAGGDVALLVTDLSALAAIGAGTGGFIILSVDGGAAGNTPMAGAAEVTIDLESGGFGDVAAESSGEVALLATFTARSSGGPSQYVQILNVDAMILSAANGDALVRATAEADGTVDAVSEVG